MTSTPSSTSTPSTGGFATAKDGPASPWRHLYTVTGLALLVGLLYLIFGFSGYGELTVDQYVRGLGSPEPRMRWLAAMALGQKLGPEASAARAEAGPALDQARVSLERLVETDQHPVVRAAAATALQSVGTFDSVAPLARALKADDVGQVRLCAVGALSRLGSSAVVDPLLESLSDSDAQVREASARALVGLGPESAGRARERVRNLSNAGEGLARILDAAPPVSAGSSAVVHPG